MLLVEKALETTQLRREVRVLRARDRRSRMAPAASSARARPSSRCARCSRRSRVSPASTVLLTGESGTGKDLAAKVLHYSSSRASKPFMNITCSALPETLLESELFGHERGAFTGADRQKRGLIESADGGTVFLDEIGEMVPLLQAKLLRFLEEKSFKRVGGAQDIKVDVRVVAATNRSLQEEVKKGHFREDLFYRLNVMSVPLPPLRERNGDIPPLINHYIDNFNTEFRKKIRGVAPAAMTALEAYPWRGNVRELRNAVERAMLLADGNELNETHFPMLAMPRRRAVHRDGPAGRRHQPRGARTLTGGAGARAERLEPDQGGDAARPQPRSNPLPHRKVRPAQTVVDQPTRRRRRNRQRDHRAARGRACHRDRAVLRFNQPLGSGHAEPGAARLGRA